MQQQAFVGAAQAFRFSRNMTARRVAIASQTAAQIQNKRLRRQGGAGLTAMIMSPQLMANPLAALVLAFMLGLPFLLIGIWFGIGWIRALQYGFYCYVAIACWPHLRWLWGCARNRQIDVDGYFELVQDRPLLTGFLSGLVVFAVSAVPADLLLHSAGVSIKGAPWLMALAGSIGFGMFGLPFVMARIKRRQAGRTAKSFYGGIAANADSIGAGFGLYLGHSTGALASLGHGAGISAGQNVGLTLEDAAQNVLVLGGIGSGKTTRAIQPLLVQFLDQDCGGLIFDIKGDFKHAVARLAGDAGRSVSVIGPGQQGLNLLAGLSPETAASFLKSALMLNDGGKGDGFWLDTATELCRNGLGVLSFLPGRYSLHGLYQYLFDQVARTDWDAEAMGLIAAGKLGERDVRLLRAYQGYHENIIGRFDEKVVASVNATVAQVLAPFSHPDLIDAFCVDGANMASMDEVLAGKLFVVDLPLARWGLGGRVAYTFIKLRFFNVMQMRAQRADWEATKTSARPVAFICDEYQEIVSCAKDGLSDLNFWDKSRSSKCVGVISAQAVSSFYSAIGNRDLANTLLQNFRQVVCFRTEDEATINRLNNLLGRVEQAKYSYSENQGTAMQMMAGMSSNEGVSTSISFQERAVFNPQMFRQLSQNQAVALLSIGGSSADDVLTLTPVFT